MAKHEKDATEIGRVPSTERKIIVVTWKDKVTNTDVLKRNGQRRLQDIIWREKIPVAGHVLGMAPERPAHSAIDWIPVDGRKKKRQAREDLVVNIL